MFDVQEIARETIRRIGYVDADLGFSADSCAVLNAVDKQSADIAQGVDAAYESRADVRRATSSTWPAPATRG